MQVQYNPWPRRSITDYEVAEPEVELLAPKAAAGQVVSGREYVDPIPVGRGDVASAPSDLASTTGKDTGYYSRLNVRASGALYDIRLPIRVIASLKEGVVEGIWGAAVWSKSSGKVRVFWCTKYAAVFQDHGTGWVGGMHATLANGMRLLQTPLPSNMQKLV